MTPKPTAYLFIDGSNFYHNTKETIDASLGVDGFAGLFQQIEQQFDLKEIRFYDAIKDRTKEPKGYAGQQRFHANLQNKCKKVRFRSRPLKYIVSLTEEQVVKEAETAGIVDRCKKLIWGLLRRLKLIRFTKEKGIDILLVVDAIEIARSTPPGFVILLSGDADYVPAVQFIRKQGVKTLNLHTYRGSATELRNACNYHALIDFNEAHQPTLEWYGRTFAPC